MSHRTFFAGAAIACACLAPSATPLAAQDVPVAKPEQTAPHLTDAIRIEISAKDMNRCAQIMVHAFRLPGPEAGFGPVLPDAPAGYGPRCDILESPAAGAMTEALAN